MRGKTSKPCSQAIGSQAQGTGWNWTGQDSNPDSTTYLLCDPEWVTKLFWIPVFLISKISILTLNFHATMRIKHEMMTYVKLLVYSKHLKELLFGCPSAGDMFLPHTPPDSL